jgi:hypothetical protein
VDTRSVTENGERARALPAVVHMSGADPRTIASPGTQRALKAQTGRSYDEMVADATDRFQTMIWMKLRREIPDLRWEECAEIDIVIDEGAEPADPTRPSAFGTSPPSAGSGA